MKKQNVTGAIPPLGPDLIIPVLAIGLALYFLLDTVSLAWEARATGTAIASILLLLALVQIARIGALVIAGRGSLRLGAFAERSTVQAQRLGLLVIMAVFILTIRWTGTTLGLFMAMAASMWVLGVRSLRTLLGISACVAGVVFLLFIVLLQSRLPVGQIEILLRSFFAGHV
jgi:hypothetical protein